MTMMERLMKTKQERNILKWSEPERVLKPKLRKYEPFLKAAISKERCKSYS
jgi:hypothetical protein